ncbi:MAG: AAA family ATPase [Clostridia bacterium]
MTDIELKKEKDYLKTVLYILDKKIKENKDFYDTTQEKNLNTLKYIWNEDEHDPDVVDSLKADIYIGEYCSNNAKVNIKAYERMIKSAYFARIDFDDGEEVLPIYLGIATLEDDSHFYVYDWRAPIASMFYEYELGDASYTLPSGACINGKITLKRQYKIEGDKITQIFDTDMQVIDEILKEMLSSKATSKMKNIVRTIQKEQNKVIRNNASILIVQGPAGSGKTSIAMHKIAYLLYNNKDTIKNSNILIISPNDIFSDYISAVLPEIGEDNVCQTTFMDYIRTMITDFKIKGSMNEIYEEIYSNEKINSVIKNSAKLKFSAVYIKLIEDFLHKNKNELLCINDIIIDNKMIIDKEFLQKYSDELTLTNKSYKERNRMMVQKILLHLDIKLRKDVKQKNLLKKQLESVVDKIKPKDLYVALYSNRDEFIGMIEKIYNEVGTSKNERLSLIELAEVFDYTKTQLLKNNMPFEDVTAYMYLRTRLLGATKQATIKHILIDEAQDYTLMQYYLIASMFINAKITLMGDINQSIMPYSRHTSFDSILNILKADRNGDEVDEKYLSKTYRSTTEINDFAKKLLGGTSQYTQIDRHGDEVDIIKDTDNYASSKIISDAINNKKLYNTVAIITKTEKETINFKKAVEAMKIADKFHFITGTDNMFVADKIMVLPSYISKGLEFDCVLLSRCNDSIYLEEDKNLFYVCATRALHKLSIYYTDKLTRLINF